MPETREKASENNVGKVEEKNLTDAGVSVAPVSYTHLDVYKRQISPCFLKATVRKPGYLSPYLDKQLWEVKSCLLYTSRCV